jgi:hypothetical protein
MNSFRPYPSTGNYAAGFLSILSKFSFKLPDPFPHGISTSSRYDDERLYAFAMNTF